MIRNLFISALIGLFVGWLPVPALAQKAPLAPQVDGVVKAQAPEAVKTSLRQDAGARRGVSATASKAVPEVRSESDKDLRMLVVALLLMVAIAIRRYRSDAR